MENEFIKKISTLSDEALVKMLTVERKKYLDEALEAAEREIKKREIKLDDYSEFINEEKQIIETEKVNVSSFTRFINYIIDLIVWFIIVFIFEGVAVGIVGNDSNPYLISLITILVFTLSFIGYFYFMENKYQRTVGKFLTKTKVVNIKGEKPTNNEILMRSISRLIPFDNISYLFTPNGLHDRFSNTKVVNKN